MTNIDPDKAIKKNVLDEGFIEVVDYLGSDLTVVNLSLIHI